MSSDRLALDPTAGAGDAVQRLMARVAELEQQVASIRAGASASVVTWRLAGTGTQTRTYSARGGFVVVLGTGGFQGPGTAPGSYAELVINGAQAQTSYIQGDTAAPNSQFAFPPLVYVAGRLSGDQTIVLQKLAGTSGNVVDTSITVFEFPAAA